MPAPKKNRTCDVAGCSEKHLTAGMCSLHFQREKNGTQIKSCRAPGCNRLVTRVWCSEHRASSHRFLKTGVTNQDFERMVEEQGGRCAICRTRDANSQDHNHKTGAPRRPLCSTCNWGLGHFQDDPELMRAAALYIEEHS